MLRTLFDTGKEDIDGKFHIRFDQPKIRSPNYYYYRVEGKYLTPDYDGISTATANTWPNDVLTTFNEFFLIKATANY